MANAPEPRLVVDFDKPGSPPGPDSKRCDYLFIAEGKGNAGWVAPLELKRGRPHVQQITKQLQAGAGAAERLIAPKERVRFLPIVACGRIPKAQRNQLRKKRNRIKFHGQSEPVRCMRCDTPLSKML